MQGPVLQQVLQVRALLRLYLVGLACEVEVALEEVAHHDLGLVGSASVDGLLRTLEALLAARVRVLRSVYR